MKDKLEKPSAESKALSLYLMAFKKTSPHHKEKSKRLNRLWGLVQKKELDPKLYAENVLTLLNEFGGYQEVLEETVKFYVDKTGEWTLSGNDKYCIDAKIIADKLTNK